ncbi:MAG: LysM peptidoglycan-binding domain-containing protein [Oligoflexia bacterium]|nr:LysM peptidoglycan-binding domain-containing protein [Oligoflexia bacterium]
MIIKDRHRYNIILLNLLILSIFIIDFYYFCCVCTVKAEDVDEATATVTATDSASEEVDLTSANDTKTNNNVDTNTDANTADTNTDIKTDSPEDIKSDDSDNSDDKEIKKEEKSEVKTTKNSTKNSTQNLTKKENASFKDDSNLEDVDMSSLETKDDLSSLKNDLGVNLEYLDEDVLEKKVVSKKNKIEKKKEKSKSKSKSDSNSDSDSDSHSAVSAKSDEKEEVARVNNLQEEEFSINVGKEEKELLGVAKRFENKIPEKEWSEIAEKAKTDKYVVAEGDSLWDISKKLFGSGFYYGKIWSLNAYITNPHEIKADMALVFDTGDSTIMPKVKVGSFSEGEDSGGTTTAAPDEGDGIGSGGDKSLNDKSAANLDALNSDFNNFGDESEPAWIKERKELRGKGVYFQYATDKTYTDIKKASSVHLTREYDKYEPPVPNVVIEGLKENYDESGFSKDSKISFNFKEGFSTITFVTSNLVNDLGVIDSSKTTANFISSKDITYIRFNPSVKVSSGDKFSIYAPMGKVSYKKSDRVGYKYSIIGELQLIRKVSDLWEATILDANGLIQRGSRITTHTPRIKKIIKTFNIRTIEALVVGGFSEINTTYSYGDIIYLDRGRADGVEVGNIFEIFEFEDRLTGKKITKDPTYKIGELTVITLTDNYATALVTFSADTIDMGSLAITKTKANAALASRVKKRNAKEDLKKIENRGLEELDVELNLEDVDKKLLEKADKIELTEDELEELERQEREKSFVQKGEKDLQELERLEKDIESAEAQLNAVKVDEDKFLQDQDMNDIEKKTKTKQKDIFESLNEIEKKAGRKYMDENLNSKENPYGLTNFDLEEVDELLNTKAEAETENKKSSSNSSSNSSNDDDQ